MKMAQVGVRRKATTASQALSTTSPSGRPAPPRKLGTSRLTIAYSKSKLRRNDAASLGAQYRGARVSRAALDDSGEDDDDQRIGHSDEDFNGVSGSEGFDDPETADLEADEDHDEDAEIDSDEAFGESDEDRFKGFAFRGSSKTQGANGKRAKRPLAADFLSSSGDEDDAATGGESDAGSGDSDTGASDGSDRRTAREIQAMMGEDDSNDDDEQEATRAEVRQMLKQDKRSVLAPISQSARADAEKGLAVRQQRRSFDALLNIRIRLQRALVAVNSLSTVTEDLEDGTSAYQGAEDAALQLWTSLDSFRDSLPLASSETRGQKRKRQVDMDSPSADIWALMDQTEARAGADRKSILAKWSARIQQNSGAGACRFIAQPSYSLVDTLEVQLLSADRLIKRTRTPRSCAPVQAARKTAEDRDIYDDADFYQLLLKELVEQRTADPAAPTVRWAAIKEAKSRKPVDRKASKGRKLRYAVHDKLQNFMAPEDRTSWEPQAVDRFFGALFGRQTALPGGEGGGGAESDDDAAGASRDEEGLRLFRS